jgi:hypothetical protein
MLYGKYMGNMQFPHNLGHLIFKVFWGSMDPSDIVPPSTGTAEQGGRGGGIAPPTFSVDNKKLPDKIQPACVE